MSTQQTPPTFEEVDRHVRTLAAPSAPPPAIAAAASANLCPAYKAVRPILMMVTGFPFFPASWRLVVTQFTGLLDVICP